MANQIVVSSGAKVRDLNDVIIGTSGVLSSLAFNVANGVPKLDVNGKILVSQLPNSVMEYQGTWNAATNTPTLVNGTGNQGDVYLCNVAGTTNFGAGPITFAVGDSAIYSGTIWQRAGGATGTVTSVGLTSTGNDAITITGSPITTSGNINLGFAGTNLQYINGAGDLTTFPTLISSIGLTMPSAFSVANSPLTANGTIAVTGAGVASQYIRGDGTLADFPTSGGGGSSVSYYLNGGTSQGIIGGVTYYEMSKTADTGAGVDFPKTGDGLIVSFLTDAGDPAQLNIPAGNWNYEIYASMSANGGTPEMYAELYKYDGTTFTLIATSPHEILYDGTALNLYTFAMTVPSTTLAITDRLAIKLYATNSGGKTTTVHTQDSHLCQIITTFSTGITALNGLTAQVQYFATGTSGTDFNISSTTATHTFNIPDASASARGLITTGTQTIAGLKTITGTSLILAPSAGDGGILNLKRGAYTGGINDYTSITSQGDDLSLVSLTSSTNRSIKFDFSSITSGILRTYTLPNASGTISLLESTQTFSGVNTFSALTSFTFSSGTRMDYGPYLTKGSVPTVFSGSTTNIYSDATTNNIVIRDNSSIAKLEFNNSTQTFTFPSASGTIALTSNLSSYVPYSGATTDLNLGLFNLYANQLNTQALDINTIGGGSAPINFYMSSVQKASIGASSSTLTFSAKNTNGFQFQNPSNAIIFSISNTGVLGNGTYSYTLPSATGILALTSDLTSFVTLTGTQTLSNKSFSNEVNLSSNGFILAGTGGVNPLQMYSTANTSTFLFGSNSFGTNINNNLFYSKDANNRSVLVFNNTAERTYTFPNASGTLALTSDLGSYLPLTGGTLTGGLYINPTNLSTVGLDVATRLVRFRSDNLDGFKRQLTIAMSSGTLVQMTAEGFGGTYGTDLAFYTSSASGVNGSPAMYITGGNRIGLGTGSPAYTLDIVGTLGVSSTSYFAGDVGIGTMPTTKFDVIGTSKFTAIASTFNGTVQSVLINSIQNTALTLNGGASSFVYQTFAQNQVAKFELGIDASTSNFYISNVPQTGSSNANFTINKSSGAATFSSSVQATKLTLNTGATNNVYIGQNTGAVNYNVVSLNGQTGEPPLHMGLAGGGVSDSTLYVSAPTGGSIRFRENGTGGAGMILTAGGNLGVGTTAPNAALEVFKTTATMTNDPGNSQLRVSASSIKFLSLGYDPTANVAYLQGTEAAIAWRPLHLNNNGAAVYAGSVRLDTLSDERIKDNIQPITNALNKVLSITGKKFHLKDEVEGKLRYGFIAQELEGILDEFVIQTDMTFKKDDLIVENVKSVDNWASSWSALLVEAIKEMYQQNQELKDRLTKLENN